MQISYLAILLTKLQDILLNLYINFIYFFSYLTLVIYKINNINIIILITILKTIIFAIIILLTIRIFFKKENKKYRPLQILIITIIFLVFISKGIPFIEQSECLTKGNIRGLQLSTNLNYLFYIDINTNQLYAFDINNNSKNIIYTCNKFGEYTFSINNKLYFIDRSNNQLLEYNLINKCIRIITTNNLLNEGDPSITGDGANIYVLVENYYCILKINPINKVTEIVTLKDTYSTEFSRIVYSDKLNYLFASNWRNYKYNKKYYLWIISPKTLKPVNLIEMPGPIFDMYFSQDGNILYATIPFSFSNILLKSSIIIFNLDNYSFSNYNSSFGTILISVLKNDRHNLIITGNYSTGIIQIIDLSINKIIKQFKTGSFVDHIVYDHKNNQIFIATKNGLYHHYF